MTQYVGLDISLKETKLHVLDEAAAKSIDPDQNGLVERCAAIDLYPRATFFTDLP